MSQEDVDRYHREAHRMQTGVMMMMPSKETEPKHLRVGINAAMSDQGGLVRLLIEKGLFTQDEYEKAVADAMTREAADYEARVREKVGPQVTLG